MPYVKKGAQTEIGKKVEELAKEIPAPLSWLIPDPYTDPTGGFGLTPTPLGFTKKAAAKTIFDAYYNHPRGKSLEKGLRDLLKVVGKTPKKAIEHIDEFRLEPAFVSTGRYSPSMINVFPSDKVSGSTMAATFAHEAGHGGTMPIAGKVRARIMGIPPIERARVMGTPQETGVQLYRSGKEPFEGAAEYIGHHLQRQAGLIPFRFFGHGEGQKAVFEELSKMPSKNPWMNVYRYFQKVMK